MARSEVKQCPEEEEASGVEGRWRRTGETGRRVERRPWEQEMFRGETGKKKEGEESPGRSHERGGHDEKAAEGERRAGEERKFGGKAGKAGKTEGHNRKREKSAGTVEREISVKIEAVVVGGSRW